MASLLLYFVFPGTCKEAMMFYSDALRLHQDDRP